jgi:hypothetical protein
VATQSFEVIADHQSAEIGLALDNNEPGISFTLRREYYLEGAFNCGSLPATLPGAFYWSTG